MLLAAFEPASPAKQTAADLRLRPRGHCDRLEFSISHNKCTDFNVRTCFVRKVISYFATYTMTSLTADRLPYAARQGQPAVLLRADNCHSVWKPAYL
jgi:hypothetical protein